MKLALDRKKIAACRKIAVKISRDVRKMIDAHSTVAQERSCLRLMGVDGAYLNPKIKQYYPLANVIVDQLQEDGVLASGASYLMANACVQRKQSPAQIADEIVRSNGELRLARLERANRKIVEKAAATMARDALKKLVAGRTQRNRLIGGLTDPQDRTFKKPPLKYVIVASGNIFEDVVQARSAAQAG